MQIVRLVALVAQLSLHDENHFLNTWFAFEAFQSCGCLMSQSHRADVKFVQLP